MNMQIFGPGHLLCMVCQVSLISKHLTPASIRQQVFLAFDGVMHGWLIFTRADEAVPDSICTCRTIQLKSYSSALLGVVCFCVWSTKLTGGS